MRDGNDQDEIGFDGVEHGLREYAHKAAPHVPLKNPPTFRRGDDFGDGGSDFPGKAPSEIATALLVELDGLLEFQKRFGMELVPHFASRRSMRR